LPIALGLILISGLNPYGVFLSVGFYYIVSGCYFGVTVPVQPMKIIGAYAIATSMTASQITASGYLIGLVLLVIGGTGAITAIGRYIPKSVVRGVQLSAGTLLMIQGIKFMPTVPGHRQYRAGTRRNYSGNYWRHINSAAVGEQASAGSIAGGRRRSNIWFNFRSAPGI
jgi:MFS superfamily sulfate permease-like transporter